MSNRGPSRGPPESRPAPGGSRVDQGLPARAPSRFSKLPPDYQAQTLMRRWPPAFRPASNVGTSRASLEARGPRRFAISRLVLVLQGYCRSHRDRKLRARQAAEPPYLLRALVRGALPTSGNSITRPYLHPGALGQGASCRLLRLRRALPHRSTALQAWCIPAAKVKPQARRGEQPSLHSCGPDLPCSQPL